MISTPEEIVCTGFLNSGLDNYRGSIAFTSTHTIARKSTCGIFFGCTDDDIARVDTLLKNCETTWSHPLLLLGIFVELQRRRLADITSDIVTDVVQVAADVRSQSEEKWGWSENEGITLDDLVKVNDLRKKSIMIGEEVSIALRQLEKITAYAESLLQSSNKNLEGCLHDTNRFIHRFKEVGHDLQSFMADCNVNVSEIVLIAEMLSNDTARRQAKASTALAFVAMMFLPISALATIFAMPIFDFKANWLDVYGHPVPSSDPKQEPGLNSSASAGTKNGTETSTAFAPVASYYLWYFVELSLFLTWLVVEIWWAFASHRRGWTWKRSMTLSSLVVVSITIWSLLVKYLKRFWRLWKEKRVSSWKDKKKAAADGAPQSSTTV
ncbi:hypothetical protein B0H63DRAFT_555556 [Podospora didyma]|uniref:Uncharacterized protein n=1 Tax=Podospora didyma TaxID=330526 RepID=A0AAE0P6S0_9PEZI|nr:hypothetical protein B0H63DRAFT_555556 [Podospora didyma]